jgi:DNA-binding SARP family transcriptional activator
VPKDARPARFSNRVDASTSRLARSIPQGRRRFGVPARTWPARVSAFARSADRVALLGEFRLSWRAREVSLPEGAQRVVAYLALAAGHATTRRSLSAALWPDASAAHARSALRSTLWRIRRVAPDLVRNDGQRLSLAPSVAVDAEELRDTMRATLDEPARSDRDALATLTDAEELLADWDDDWIQVERERMHEVRLEALEALAEDLTDRGMVGQAIEAGLAAVADEPYRESAHRVLIEAYVRKGNIAAAIAHFRRLRKILRQELGVAPSADLSARIRRLESDRSTEPE